MTLLELMVVLVLVGFLTTLAAFALRRGPAPAASDEAATARLRAVTEGRPVTIRIVGDFSNKAAARRVRYLPDGRALGPGVDPLTGRALPMNADTAKAP